MVSEILFMFFAYFSPNIKISVTLGFLKVSETVGALTR